MIIRYLLNTVVIISTVECISASSLFPLKRNNNHVDNHHNNDNTNKNVITGLYLVDTRNGQDLMQLMNGTTIDTDAIGTKALTIRAQTNNQANNLQWVEFDLDCGLLQFVDEKIPYVLAGKQNDDHNNNEKLYPSFVFNSPGWHKLTVMPKFDSGAVQTNFGSLQGSSLSNRDGAAADALDSVDRSLSVRGSNSAAHQHTLSPCSNAITIQFEVVSSTTSSSGDDKDDDASSMPQIVAPPLTTVNIERSVSKTDIKSYQTSTTGSINGELKVWHTITIGFDGPDASEESTSLRNVDMNHRSSTVFADYRADVTFIHIVSGKKMIVPAYFALSNNPANMYDDIITSGSVWLCHFVPNDIGLWSWSVTFLSGGNVAPNGGIDVADYFHGSTGTFNIVESDKTSLKDLRSKGRLLLTNNNNLQFMGNGETFVPVEGKSDTTTTNNILSYSEFDGSVGGNDYKTFHKYVSDATSLINTTWKDGKGIGLVGYINHLGSQGINMITATSLTLGDGSDPHPVSPFVQYSLWGPYVYDVSKLGQWNVIFNYMSEQAGIVLHLKLQGDFSEEILDDGTSGLFEERKIYYREMIARFSHHLGMIWDIGYSDDINEVQKRIDFIRQVDPYKNPILQNGKYL